MSETGEFVYDQNTDTFNAGSEEGAYDEPWQLPNPQDYINLGGDEDPTAHPVYSRGTPARLSSVVRGGGMATVRLNQPMSISGSNIFTGPYAATVPAGGVFRGRDSNNNGIPDLLEKCLKNGGCRF